LWTLCIPVGCRVEKVDRKKVDIAATAHAQLSLLGLGLEFGLSWL